MFETNYYRTVEPALAQTYSVPKKALAAFRAKIGSMQKQGMLGTKNMPGKGKALSYGPDQFHRLIFACELFEFGVAPSVVLDLIKALWERRIAEIFRQAEKAAMRKPSDDDVIMHMGGVALMGHVLADTLPNVNSCPLRRLPDHMRMWMTMEPDDPVGLPPRALVTNLSMRLRTFHRALAAAHDLREPVPPTQAGAKELSGERRTPAARRSRTQRA
jgi:hypothetical protein